MSHTNTQNWIQEAIITNDRHHGWDTRMKRFRCITHIPPTRETLLLQVYNHKHSPKTETKRKKKNKNRTISLLIFFWTWSSSGLPFGEIFQELDQVWKKKEASLFFIFFLFSLETTIWITWNNISDGTSYNCGNLHCITPWILQHNISGRRRRPSSI